MHFKIIDDLKRADPKRRKTLLMRMREKNIRHLHKMSPELAQYLESTGTGRFEVRIDKNFLEIFDRTTGELCHPPGQMLSYMQDLGYRYHTGWIEKNTLAPVSRGSSEHGILHAKFVSKLYEAVPELPQRVAAGEVRLPPMTDGRGFSGPVVFLGIFTGLHIMYYLSRNETQNVFLIEPELDRFALSCFFLDYEALHNHFGRLLLHVGPDMPQNPVNQLINASPITAAAWVRLLPAYPNGNFDSIISKIGMRWGTLKEIFVPFDREVRNLTHAMRNLNSHVRLMGPAPKLSPASTIAIVASGPSLKNDLEWLKLNQDRMIIFSATSTVRVLKQHDIRIDFQFALDTEIEPTWFEQLQLDPEIPMVFYYKAAHELAARFKKPLFVVEQFKGNPVRVVNMLTGTHPTTGNLACALAAWAKPTRILLLGFDMSYRDAMESHVPGTSYDDNGGIGHVKDTEGVETYPVVANFPETEGKIVSHAYLDSANQCLQSLFANLLDTGCKIFNLSDGAKIPGAEALHSADLSLENYIERESDTAKIFNAFTEEHEGLWSHYEITGEKRLEQLRGAVLKAFDNNRFDWNVWPKALNAAVSNIWQEAASADDLRMDAYVGLVRDALAEWYRAALLTHSVEETEAVYKQGIAALHSLLEALVWPSELDEPAK